MKHRTTVYISDSARRIVRENKLVLSSFIEEKLFDCFGFAQTKQEMESEVNEMELKLQDYRVRISKYDDEQKGLEKYCNMIIDRMASTGWGADRCMEALKIHLKDPPMCDMSMLQLKVEIERRR